MFKINLFILYLIFHAILSASPFDLNHIQRLGYKGDNIEELYSQLKYDSGILNFFDCPIELIERQWGGSRSVIIGTKILEQFIGEIENPTGALPQLITQCEEQLAIFRQESKKGFIRSRSIVLGEYDDLVSFLQSGKRLPLMNEILSAINQKTPCYSNGYSVSFGEVIAVGAGYCNMECFTPLGRRFTSRGISYSYGVGAGVIATLPNIKSMVSEPDYQLSLFQQKEKSKWRTSHNDLKIALVGGASSEQEFGKSARDDGEAQMQHYDLRAAAGVGIINEIRTKRMKKSSGAPLYYNLSRALDIHALAQAVNM